MRKENIYEKKARKILAYLRADVRYDTQFMPRPFFVEFTGSPSSGKTTVITELDKFFRRMGFRVWRPQEGAEVIRHIERITPLYNIRTGLYALSILIDESVGHKYDIVIFDRCVFDAYSWMMYWKERGKLQDEEEQFIQQFFLSHFWIDTIDVAYIMICDPEEALRRELKIALSKKLGETTNPETIRTLVDRSKRMYEKLHPIHAQLSLIDTTSLTEKKMVEHIAELTLKVFEEKIAP